MSLNLPTFIVNLHKIRYDYNKFLQKGTLMQLSTLLTHPQFDRIRVANHEANLEVNVITIGMMEAPDIADYVVAGQLLVTTGFHFQNNISGLLELISIMSKTGAAAIGIKQHRYFDNIPSVVLKKANELGFAILLLPEDVSLSVIVRDLLHVVLEQQTDQLATIMQQTLSLSQFILKGRSDQEILTKISSLLHQNVFLVNSYGKITAKNSLAIINQNQLEEYTQDLELLGVNTSKVIHLEEDTFLLIPLRSDSNLNRKFLFLQQKSIEYSEQRLLIENIVNLLSLENMKGQMNISAKRSRYNELFTTILNQSLSKSVIDSNLEMNNLSSEEKYQAIAIEDVRSLKAPNHNGIMHRMSDLIYWFFAKENITPIIIYWNFQLLVLIPASDKLVISVQELQKFLNQYLTETDLYIGYTSYEHKLYKVKKMVDEALEALALSLRSRKNKIMKFRPKQVSDLLQMLPQKESDSFIFNVLNPILTIKNEEEKQLLLQTLAYYFTENHSVAEVSKILFVHRNTTLYRLKKIEKIIGYSLDDFNESEQLQLAIRLYMLKRPNF